MTTSTSRRHARGRAQRSRRWGITRFALAGAALLGIGAAATSAAWTDGTWFSLQASSASVQLEASTTGLAGSWVDADADPGVTFGTTAPNVFTNLLPGQTRSATIYLKNTGSTCVNVAAATVTKSAPLDGSTATDATVTLAPGVVGDLAPNGGTATVQVTVATPALWSSTHQNVAANPTALKVQFIGTANSALSTGACP